MDEIQAKLNTLRQAYPDQESIQTLADWETTAKQAVITANLQENDAIKIIISNYQKELDDLNDILMTDESLFASDDGRLLGQTIHARKKWCTRFLNIFTAAQSTVKNVTQILDSKINAI